MIALPSQQIETRPLIIKSQAHHQAKKATNFPTCAGLWQGAGAPARAAESAENIGGAIACCPSPASGHNPGQSDEQSGGHIPRRRLPGRVRIGALLRARDRPAVTAYRRPVERVGA